MEDFPPPLIRGDVAGALEAVVHDLDEDVLADYAQQILQTFVAKLTSCSHKGVLVAIYLHGILSQRTFWVRPFNLGSRPIPSAKL